MIESISFLVEMLIFVFHAHLKNDLPALLVLPNKDVQLCNSEWTLRSFDPANGGKAVLALHGFLIVHILDMATSSSDRP